MASVDLFPASAKAYGNDEFKIDIRTYDEPIYDTEHVLIVKADGMTINMFLDTAQLEHLFGTINNALEAIKVK